MTVLDIAPGQLATPTVVATDASLGHHRGIPVAGFSWLAADGRYTIDTVATRSPLVAELTAILRAVTNHAGSGPLLVLSDCKLALIALADLRRTGVNPTPAGGQAHRDAARLLRQIGVALRGRDVELRWVKGHAGHPLNEGADRLAVQARRCVQSGGRLAGIAELADRIAAEACRTPLASAAS